MTPGPVGRPQRFRNQSIQMSASTQTPTPARPSPEEHGRRVSGMFGRIAPWYDLLNHLLSAGQDVYWRHQLARLARPATQAAAANTEEFRILDLAAGTMDVSLELTRQHPQARILAMDFSFPMLKRGRLKALRKGKPLDAVLADGKRLPLPEGCVDCITIAFGVRNILPREEAFAEALRVLKPGGRLCILEFGSGKNRIWRGIYNFYLDRLLPLVGRVVSGDAAAYRYLADTIKEFPDASSLAGELLEAGFDSVFCRPMLSGIVYLHVAGK